MSPVSTADVRAYIAHRQEQSILSRKTRRILTRRRVVETPEVRRPVSSTEIDRELTVLKRLFSLAIQAGKLLHKPHVPPLREGPARRGFFRS